MASMFNVGDKLRAKPQDQFHAEIVGLRRAGDGGLTENHYDVMVNGFRMTLKQAVIASIFDKIKSVEEPKVEEKISEPIVPQVMPTSLTEPMAQENKISNENIEVQSEQEAKNVEKKEVRKPKTIRVKRK